MATRKARYVVPAAVLAAALMVSGCGGGDSSTATPPKTDPAPPTDTKTPAQLAAEATQALDALKQAIDAVMDDSETSVVTQADGELTKARTAVAKVPAAAAERSQLEHRLGGLESRLGQKKTARTAAMDTAREMGMAEPMKLRSGMVFRNDEAGAARRDVYFSDSGVTLNRDPRFSIAIGTEDTNLKRVKDAMVEALGGGHHVTNEFYGGPWPGSKWTAAPDGKGTYTAMVWSGGRTQQGRSLSQIRDYLRKEKWVRHQHVTEDYAKISPEGFGFGVSPVQTYPLEGGAKYVEFRGIYDTNKGTYRCVPNLGQTCAARQQGGGQGSSSNIYGETWSTVEVGGVGPANNFEPRTKATWTFKPDHPDRKKLTEAKQAPYYGWWLHVSESGEMTASAFTTFRGTSTSDKHNIPANWRTFAHEDRKTFGTAKYRGGAAGLYALGAESGEFIAKAAFDVDFGNAVDDLPGQVTGVIDGFMVRGLDSDKARESRDWKVELTRRDIGASNNALKKYDLLPPAEGVVGGEKTRWLLDGDDPSSAAPLSGQWDGEFREWDEYGNIPAHLTGTFLSERTGGKMIGAFGTDSALVERPHYDD